MTSTADFDALIEPYHEAWEPSSTAIPPAISRVGYPLPSTWGRSVTACHRSRRSPESTIRAASTS